MKKFYTIENIKKVIENNKIEIIARLLSTAFLIVLLFVFFIGDYFFAIRPESEKRTQTIYDVDRLSFEIPKDLLGNVIPLLEISKDTILEDGQTYKYTNEDGTYVLICPNKYFIFAKKGTHFSLNEMSAHDSFSQNNVYGVEFILGSDTENADKKSYGYKISTNAMVPFNAIGWHNYYGDMHIFEQDDTEWMFFAGASTRNIDELNDRVKEMKSIAATAKLDDNWNFIRPVSKIDPNNGSCSTPSSLLKEPSESALFPYNQASVYYEEGYIYTSSKYSMLSIGQVGEMSIKDDYYLSGRHGTAYVHAKRIIDAEELEQLIDSHIASGNSYYSEMTPPDGCHFEAVEFDLQYQTEYDLYAVAEVLGLDGEPLIFEGAKYPTKTHFIMNEDKQDGWYKNSICFYLVPNGCSEYVLRFGSGSGLVFGDTYYHIH